MDGSEEKRYVAENKSMQPAGLNERDGCLLPNKEGAIHMLGIEIKNFFKYDSFIDHWNFVDLFDYFEL